MRRRKGKLNLAVILMIFTTICLSTIQVGFSFLNQDFIIDGVLTIKSSSPSTKNDPLTLVTNSNSEFILKTEGSTDTNITGSGYKTIIKAGKNSTLNNYLKFNANATELWRIVGWTSDGIKIVKDQPLKSDPPAKWAVANDDHWVKLPLKQSIQSGYTMVVTSLEEMNDMCKYLNGTFLNQLLDTNNPNHINVNYLNLTPTWDITPMNITSNKPYYISGTQAGSIKVTATTNESFKGIPIGLLSITERCIVSAIYPTDNPDEDFTTLLEGWLAGSNTSELAITERVQGSFSTTSYSTSQVFYTNNEKVYYVNKSGSDSYSISPAMYLNSNVLFETKGAGTAGSKDNPFIIKGVS